MEDLEAFEPQNFDQWFKNNTTHNKYYSDDGGIMV